MADYLGGRKCEKDSSILGVGRWFYQWRLRKYTIPPESFLLEKYLKAAIRLQSQREIKMFGVRLVVNNYNNKQVVTITKDTVL